MITDAQLNDILNADTHSLECSSLRHYDSEICQAVEELQAYRKAMYDARKQAHLFDSGLGMLMCIATAVKAYYEEGLE